MIELILIKATVALFNTLRVRLLPHINLEVLTLSTMFSVCFEWWRVISYRKRNKRLIRWWFREKVCVVLVHSFLFLCIHCMILTKSLTRCVGSVVKPQTWIFKLMSYWLDSQLSTPCIYRISQLSDTYYMLGLDVKNIGVI